MNIAIVGGTGTVGAEAARELAARGHDVRVLARHAPEYPVDLDDRRGARAPRSRAWTSSSTPPRARARCSWTARRGCCAPGRRPAWRHHVGVSIVGIDRVGGPYYRAKLDQEAEIRRSGVPWTIVRATQFHTLVARTFAASARLGVVPSCARRCSRSIRARSGGSLADTAEAEPSFAITQFAGPEVVSVARAGAALAGGDRLARAARAAARVALAARRRADEPGRLARHGHLRRVAGVMTDLELAERFEALRPRLLRLAYGQLGSLAEAEDVAAGRVAAAAARRRRTRSATSRAG